MNIGLLLAFVVLPISIQDIFSTKKLISFAMENANVFVSKEVPYGHFLRKACLLNFNTPSAWSLILLMKYESP